MRVRFGGAWIADSEHVLLLFEGAERHPDFAAIGDLVRGRYTDRITGYIVAHLGRRPEGLRWDGPLLLDGDGALHHRFGARAECLYMIRPDHYIGYRAQPPDAEKLRAYLDGIFL